MGEVFDESYDGWDGGAYVRWKTYNSWWVVGDVVDRHDDVATMWELVWAM